MYLIKNLKPIIALTAVTASLYMCSCNDDYDLSKDISSEITVGGSLVFPVGETVDLKFSRVIGLTEDLKVNGDGIYSLGKEDRLDVKIPYLEPVSIRNLTTQLNKEHIIINPEGARSDVVLPEYVINRFVDYSLQIDTEEEVPEEIRSLTYVELNDVAVNLHVDIRFQDQSTLQRVATSLLDNFSVTFPDVFVFSEGMKNFDYSTNTLQMNGYRFDENGRLTVPLKIAALKNFPEVDPVKHTVKLKYGIGCKGNVNIDCRNITMKEIQDIVLETQLEVPTLDIDRAQGVFSPEIKVEAATVSFGELPDMLTDGKTNLNLSRIYARMNIKNPSGVPFNTGFVFRAFDAGNNPVNEPVEFELPVKASRDYNTVKESAYIVTNDSECAVPEGYEKILVPNLTKIVGTIPDYITVEPTVTVDDSQEHYIKLGNELSAAATYSISLPFVFNTGSEIHYVETAENLQADISDILDKFSEAVVETEISSTVPMELVLNMKLFDQNGNSLDNAIDVTPDFAVKPGANAQTLQLKELQAGALKQLDKIEFHIEGRAAADNVAIAPEQGLKLQIRARLPKGINIDFDNL